MSFTSGIPSTGQSLDQTRDPIRNNFTNYFNVVSQDHEDPNNSGEGKHKKSTYKVQGSPPTSLANEIVAFAQTSNGNSEIFVQRDGVATNVRLTGPSSSLNGTLSRGGTTSILGGLMLKWAVVNAAGVYTWAAESGSAFNSDPIIWGILPLTDGSASFSATITAATATNFTIVTSVSHIIQVIAIGA